MFVRIVFQECILVIGRLYYLIMVGGGVVSFNPLFWLLVNPWNFHFRKRLLSKCFVTETLLSSISFRRCDLYRYWFVPIYYCLHYVVMWLCGLSLAFHVEKSCCSCSGSWLFYRLDSGSRVGGCTHFPKFREVGWRTLPYFDSLIRLLWPLTKIDLSLLLPVWCLLIIEIMSCRFISSVWYSDMYHIVCFIGVEPERNNCGICTTSSFSLSSLYF